MNCLLILNCWFWQIEVLQVNYPNNTIEQDHSFIKKLIRQIKDFKSVISASATLDSILAPPSVVEGPNSTPMNCSLL